LLFAWIRNFGIFMYHLPVFGGALASTPASTQPIF
jgi:hypothetical protein